jgi:hypothetical protein
METTGVVLLRPWLNRVGEFLETHQLLSRRMETCFVIVMFAALALIAIGERRGWGWLEMGALSIGVLAIVCIMLTEAIKLHHRIVTSKSKEQIQLITVGSMVLLGAAYLLTEKKERFFGDRALGILAGVAGFALIINGTWQMILR